MPVISDKIHFFSFFGSQEEMGEAVAGYLHEHCQGHRLLAVSYGFAPTSFTGGLMHLHMPYDTGAGMGAGTIRPVQDGSVEGVFWAFGMTQAP